MASSNKNKGLTRDQAAELYKDLQKTIQQIKDDGGTTPAKVSAAKPPISSARSRLMAEMKKVNLTNKINFPMNGQTAAITLLTIFGVCKIAVSAMQYTGFANVEMANATAVNATKMGLTQMAPDVKFSKEEVEILTQLDKRRAELEARSEKLSEKEQELATREMEMAGRMTELKSLTDQLKIRREQNDRKKDTQMEQLSKVYSSMAPEEAAKLIEQLDITIALSLLQRMPEKRIAQILALMNSERALGLTKMLTQ